MAITLTIGSSFRSYISQRVKNNIGSSKIVLYKKTMTIVRLVGVDIGPYFTPSIVFDILRVLQLRDRFTYWFSQCNSIQKSFTFQVHMYNDQVIGGGLTLNLAEQCKNAAAKMNDTNLVASWKMVEGFENFFTLKAC